MIALVAEQIAKVSSSFFMFVCKYVVKNLPSRSKLEKLKPQKPICVAHFTEKRWVVEIYNFHSNYDHNKILVDQSNHKEIFSNHFYLVTSGC